MSNLFVLTVANEKTAERMVERLKQLQEQRLIQLDDAAMVTLNRSGRPKIRQLHDMVGVGALGEAFWGLLFGLIFFAPFLGLITSTNNDTIAKKFARIGIDEDFVKDLGEKLRPGQCALFAVTQSAITDAIRGELKTFKAELIQSALPQEHEEELREMIGVQDVKKDVAKKDVQEETQQQGTASTRETSATKDTSSTKEAASTKDTTGKSSSSTTKGRSTAKGSSSAGRSRRSSGDKGTSSSNTPTSKGESNPGQTESKKSRDK